MPPKYTKRADGRYCTHVVIGTKSDGSRHRKTVYAKTIRELEEKAAELRRQVGAGEAIGSEITVSEWVDTWLSIYKTGVEYNTTKMYELITNNYIKKTIGFMRLKDVKTLHLQKIINENQQKSWIVKKFKITINQIFEQAIINDMLSKNPARGIKLPKMQAATKKRALTESEIEKIKTLPLDVKTKCFVFLLLYTGMRKSEVLALTKNDINLERMDIAVNKTLVFKSNKSVVKDTPKTRAGARTIKIFAPLYHALLEHLNALDTEMLFTTAKGDTVTDTSYRRMWAKFTAAMGETDITAHIFRHNFASMLYDAGVDIKVAQAMLGHESIQVTMDIYTHLGKNQIDNNADKLEEYFAGSRGVVTRNK